MGRAVLGAVALWFGAIGAVMLATPVMWYEATPGVVQTGPFNRHFVVDIGLIFAVSAAAILAGAARRDRALCLSGLGWPLAHAVYHLWLLWVQGNCAQGELAANLAGLQAPAWGGLWAAIVMQQKTGET